MYSPSSPGNDFKSVPTAPSQPPDQQPHHGHMTKKGTSFVPCNFDLKEEEVLKRYHAAFCTLSKTPLPSNNVIGMALNMLQPTDSGNAAYRRAWELLFGFRPSRAFSVEDVGCNIQGTVVASCVGYALQGTTFIERQINVTATIVQSAALFIISMLFYVFLPSLLALGGDDDNDGPLTFMVFNGLAATTQLIVIILCTRVHGLVHAPFTGPDMLLAKHRAHWLIVFERILCFAGNFFMFVVVLVISALTFEEDLMDNDSTHVAIAIFLYGAILVIMSLCWIIYTSLEDWRIQDERTFSFFDKYCHRGDAEYPIGHLRMQFCETYDLPMMCPPAVTVDAPQEKKEMEMSRV